MYSQCKHHGRLSNGFFGPEPRAGLRAVFSFQWFSFQPEGLGYHMQPARPCAGLAWRWVGVPARGNGRLARCVRASSAGSPQSRDPRSAGQASADATFSLVTRHTSLATARSARRLRRGPTTKAPRERCEGRNRRGRRERGGEGLLKTLCPPALCGKSNEARRPVAASSSTPVVLINSSPGITAVAGQAGDATGEPWHTSLAQRAARRLVAASSSTPVVLINSSPGITAVAGQAGDATGEPWHTSQREAQSTACCIENTV